MSVRNRRFVSSLWIATWIALAATANESTVIRYRYPIIIRHSHAARGQ